MKRNLVLSPMQAPHTSTISVTSATLATRTADCTPDKRTHLRPHSSLECQISFLNRSTPVTMPCISTAGRWCVVGCRER